MRECYTCKCFIKDRFNPKCRKTLKNPEYNYDKFVEYFEQLTQKQVVKIIPYIGYTKEKACCFVERNTGKCGPKGINYVPNLYNRILNFLRLV